MRKICKNPRSLGYYIENDLGIELKDIWDYDKNTKNPDEILKKTKMETVWIKCTKNEVHGSYEITPLRFTNNGSSTKCCPYCARRSSSKEVHIEESFVMRFPQYVKWWSDENKKSPFDYRGNEWDVIKFTCPECGWSFEKTLRSITPFSFTHRCKEDLNEKTETILKYEDYKFQQRLNHFKDKVNSVHGEGAWTVKEFDSTGKPGILVHSCGHEKHLSKMGNAYKKNLTCENCK